MSTLLGDGASCCADITTCSRYKGEATDAPQSAPGQGVINRAGRCQSGGSTGIKLVLAQGVRNLSSGQSGINRILVKGRDD